MSKTINLHGSEYELDVALEKGLCKIVEGVVVPLTGDDDAPKRPAEDELNGTIITNAVGNS